MGVSFVEMMLAWRYLRARRAEGFISITTWFAVLGIALGVATLILVTSLMNGIRDEMTSRFIGLDGHISVYSASGPFTNYRAAADVVTQVPGVRSVTAKVEGQAMASAHGAALGAQVIALPWQAVAERPMFTQHVTSGSLDGLKDGTGIVLGEYLARDLHVGAGDTVTLISPQGRATIAGFIPRMKAYPVAATVKLGMNALDSSLILMPFDEAQTYFLMRNPQGDAISRLEIMVPDADDAYPVAHDIAQRLGPDARIATWQTTNAGIFAALAVQRNVMVIILALIILVAAFNIVSSLVMLVKDKGHDIAILRTIGATKGSVTRIFMLAGTAIGVAGMALGVGLGLVLAAHIEAIHHFVEHVTGQQLLVEDIYFLSSLPTKTEPREVAVIVLLALALSFLARSIPRAAPRASIRAEALRYE